MSLSLRTVRHSATGFIFALLLTVAGPMTTLAGGSVNCSFYGRLYTFGNTTSTQHHWVQDVGTTSSLGSGYKSHYWGYYSGWRNWDVYGVGVTAENASCIPT